MGANQVSTLLLYVNRKYGKSYSSLLCSDRLDKGALHNVFVSGHTIVCSHMRINPFMWINILSCYMMGVFLNTLVYLSLANSVKQMIVASSFTALETYSMFRRAQ